jgi:hypothetical protein
MPCSSSTALLLALAEGDGRVMYEWWTMPVLALSPSYGAGASPVR